MVTLCSINGAIYEHILQKYIYLMWCERTSSPATVIALNRASRGKYVVRNDTTYAVSNETNLEI